MSDSWRMGRECVAGPVRLIARRVCGLCGCAHRDVALACALRRQPTQVRRVPSRRRIVCSGSESCRRRRCESAGDCAGDAWVRLCPLMTWPVRLLQSQRQAAWRSPPRLPAAARAVCHDGCLHARHRGWKSVCDLRCVGRCEIRLGRSQAKLIASPFAPARAVRPIR